MPNRNRQRGQRRNRGQARRSRSPERRNEDIEIEEEPTFRTELRQLRTWDDLLAERQIQVVPRVQTAAANNYRNEEVNDNRPWADIVEEELYQANSNPEQAADLKLWTDIMDEETNSQALSTIQAPAAQDDLQYDLPEQIDMVLDEDIIYAEQDPIDLIINESIEEVEDNIVEDAFALVPDGEHDNLGSPVQAPANLVESAEDESDDSDYDIPIEWADDILHLEIKEDDISILSNPGRYHTEDNNEHPLSTNITEAEMSLLPPPLLPVITHDFQVTSKDNQKNKPTATTVQIKVSSIDQNPQQSGKPQGSEKDNPIHILWADEVEEEQKTEAHNRTKTPAVKEDVSRSREQRSAGWKNLPSTSTKTDSTSAHKPGKKSTNQGKSESAKIMHVKDLERTWQSAASHKHEKVKKDDRMLQSSVKIKEHGAKDVKQQKMEDTLPKIVPTFHEKHESEEKKQKVQWSNLIPQSDNTTVVDNEEFPLLGSTKYPTHKKITDVKTKTVKNKQQEKDEQPIAQSTSLVQVRSVSKIPTQGAQKKKSRKQWHTFKTPCDERSSDQQFPNPDHPHQGSSSWRKPYSETKPYYSNFGDRQPNRDDENFRQERFGRPWAEVQHPTKSFSRSQASKSFRVQGTTRGRTNYQTQRSDYQQRYERSRSTPYENRRNYGKPEDSQRSQRGWDNQQQFEQHEERSGERDDQRTKVRRSKSDTKKNYTQVQYKNPESKLAESQFEEDTAYPRLGSAKNKSKFDTYVSPLKTRKSQGIAKDVHDKEPQRPKTPIQSVKKFPINVSKSYTKQHPPIQVITAADYGMQTDDGFQSVETVCSNVDNIYEETATNTKQIANDIGKCEEIAKVSKLSALSLEFVPKRTIEVVNLKLNFKDGTVVEDEFIPEPVAPLQREDGSIAPADELQFLHEKRKYFQARCRKLIIQHYPNEDISSKRPNETYEGMYNRLMEEETERLCVRIRTEARALSVSRERTDEIAEQRPPSSGSKQRFRGKESTLEIKTEVKVTKVPKEKNKQTAIPDKELVESEQVVYPEHFWKNNEEVNRILDEEELQEIDWLTPKLRKRSKNKKVESTNKQTETPGRDMELVTPTSQQRSKSKKGSSTVRQSEVTSNNKKQSPHTRSVPKERKLKTDIADKRQSKCTDKQNKVAANKKASVCRNLEAHFKQVRVHNEQVPDDDVSAKLSSPTNKRTKCKVKKTQEVTVSVPETADVGEEEILIVPVPPTPMPDGYIDPKAQERYEQDRYEYFEGRCKLLIKMYYPAVDINSRRKKESYEDMYTRLLSEETKLLAERNKKSKKYFKKQKEAAARKMNKLIKVTPKKSPRTETKAVPKPLELHADIEEKDDSSNEDATETLSTPEEFVSADDELDTSSSNSPKRKIQKPYRTRKNIATDRAAESESETPVSIHRQKQTNKASGDEDNDNLLESDPPALFFTPTEFLQESEEQTQLESRKKCKRKRNIGKTEQRSDPLMLSDEGDLHPKLQTIEDKHVQFVDQVQAVPRVDVEKKLPERYSEEISDPWENTDDYLKDEAAAFPLSELEIEAKHKSQKEKATSAEEKMVVPEDSEAKFQQAKSCANLPLTGEVKLTKAQRKRANAKNRALLAKQGGNSGKETVVDVIYKEPNPPVPDEYGFIDPQAQAKFEQDKKAIFQAKCKRLILRDYPDVDINSKLANETYEEMYNRLLRMERLNADRRLEQELSKLEELKEKFDKYKLKKK